MADALGTAGLVVSAQEHRLAITAMLAGQSTGILDARLGVVPGPNSLALVTGTSATAPMTVAIAAHQAATARTSAQGTYMGPTLEAPTTVNIAAAPSSNSRIDVVYAVQQDADAAVLSPDGSTAPVWAVATGTSSATPVKPSIPVGALELATVTVTTGATATNGGLVTISNTVPQTVARGGIRPSRSGDVTPGGYGGAARYNMATNVLELWNFGTSTWVPYASSASVSAAITAATAAVGKRVVKNGTQTISNSWTVLTWDGPDLNLDALDSGSASMWNPAVPGDLVAPVKGLYAVTCGVESLTNIQIRKNAGGVVTAGIQVTASNGGTSGPTTAYNNAAASGFLLRAGDYVTAFGYNTTSQAAGTASGYLAFFSLTLIARLP